MSAPVLRILAVNVILSSIAATRLVAQSPDAAEQFFEAEVRPLLIAKCHECHSSSLQESDLRLDMRGAVLQGGISGPAAVPQRVDESLVIQAVRGTGGLERMPPDEPLEESEIATLEKWVRLGLPWTPEAEPTEIALGDQVAIFEAAKTHWAFQPIGNPAVPALTDSLTPIPHNEIDLFVAQRLSEGDLDRNPPADRRTLLRRVYYDLLGLPPTFEQVRAFTKDPRPTDVALEEVVDQLLASYQYGERWARYWLDLARYADTRDWQAQADLRYPFAYTYRDYVIESLNNDKPYDQFIREQIAADFYTDDEHAPEIAALGLLTVGPRFRNDRLELVSDQIDVVCRGLMGITVSCARCHDHKYDPVPIEDYYSLYGVFASTTIPDEFPTIATVKPEAALFEDYQRQLEAKKQDLHDYKVELRTKAIEELSTRLPVYLQGFTQMSLTKTSEIRGVVGKLKVVDSAMTPFDAKLADRLRRKRDLKDTVLKPWAIALSATEPEYKNHIKVWLDEWAGDDSIHPQVREQLTKDQPQTRSEFVTSYGKLFERVLADWKGYRDQNPDVETFVSESGANESGASELADLEPLRATLLGPGGWFDLDLEAVANASRLLGSGRRILGDLQKAIGEVDANHPGAPPRAMNLKDREQPIAPYVMLRGEASRRGDQVPRQFLEILSGKDRQAFAEGSGRRELAEAVTHPGNPLTTRVLVNRIWSKYFGRGIVDSLDDFGLRSDPPSHPELLDWLSREFQANGQSLKWLHKKIITSATYQQSSEGNEWALSVDPENRLLWRQNRKRLDFEAMRDSMLAVSGTLDSTVGGRSVHLSAEPPTHRRSVYAYVDRNEMDPMLRTFDFASPTASAASRSETTIPQQALFSMNHPFVANQSRQIAESCASPTADATIQYLYRKIFQRPARVNEVRFAESFLAQASPGDGASQSPWSYGFGSLSLAGRSQWVPQTFPHWTGQEYQASDLYPDPKLKFLRLTANGGHPGNDRDGGTYRRWTAPVDGVVTIRGKAVHTRDKSDGVTMMIKSGDFGALFHVLKSEVDTNVDSLTVQQGDVIDFVVTPGQSPSADSYTWVIDVEGIGGGLDGSKWNSQNDFHSPPPPPLSPLAQLAQALLLTNEFLYLD